MGLGTSGDRRSVFLVHGRDSEARKALESLLKAFDLKVIPWRRAAAQAGGGTPYTGDIVVAGMNMADAVVVLLTPDDVGYLRRPFRNERDSKDDLEPTGQARLNVIFEAGMAMAIDRTRVVLVEVGAVRRLTDTEGLNVIRMSDDIEKRKDLAGRLQSAGLTLDQESDDWREAGSFDRPLLTRADLLHDAAAPAPPPGEALSSDEQTVLDFIAVHFADPKCGRLKTPFDVPGLPWDRVQVVLGWLAEAVPPYITGSEVAEKMYPVVITGITERGRRATRVEM
jgi:hypothetical protein